MIESSLVIVLLHKVVCNLLLLLANALLFVLGCSLLLGHVSSSEDLSLFLFMAEALIAVALQTKNLSYFPQVVGRSRVDIGGVFI